jgi:salicylate hydroxylase
VEAYETIRQGRSKFLHEVELASITQTMFPPGPERDARDLEMQKLLHAGQDRWGDDAYLGVWGQLCEVWAYNAFDAADDWWVQWGVLREHSLRRQKSNVEAPFSPLEISVGTGYDD